MKKLAARLSLHHVPTGDDTMAYTASLLWFGISHWKEAQITLFLSQSSKTNFYYPLLL